jgi:HSP20 family protein
MKDKLVVKEPEYLSPWPDPFALVRRMVRDFDRLFEDRFVPFVGLRGDVEKSAWSPDLEIFEKDKKLYVRIDLPGLTKDDIKIEVKEGLLTITGERKLESDVKGEGWYRSERNYGTFFRTIPLPEGVKPADVKAMFFNGVLELTMPMPARVEPAMKRIEIEEPIAKVKTAA